jgi:hypothetical protein
VAEQILHHDAIKQIFFGNVKMYLNSLHKSKSMGKLFFSQKHLRVETPLTTDGVTLAYDENSQVKKRITYLPMSAKRFLEKQNANLPNHLKATITEIDAIAQAKQPPVNKAGAGVTTTAGEPKLQPGVQRHGKATTSDVHHEGDKVKNVTDDNDNQ